MKKTALALILALLLFSLSVPLMVEAQAPPPPNVETLGPPIIRSAGDSATNVKFSSPQNNSYSNNPIQLNFSVVAAGLLGQFGNVGYSLDGGTIYSVSNFVNKSVSEEPDYYYRTTVFASVNLPTLSQGVHNATVYYGWQFLGSLERYEVWAYATVVFAVGKPIILPPTIFVSSPENNLTTEDSSIPLILNVSAPMAFSAVQSQLRYAYFKADWLSEKQYLYFQNLSSDEHFQYREFNTTLSNIPNGTHKLLIVAGGSVTFNQAMFVEEFDSESNSTIIFNVNSTVQPTDNLVLNQTQIVSIVVLASVAVIGLVYWFTLRNIKRENKARRVSYSPSC